MIGSLIPVSIHLWTLLFLFHWPLSQSMHLPDVDDPVQSAVYAWPESSAGEEASVILSGSTTALSELTVYGVVMQGDGEHDFAADAQSEMLFIVKEGALAVELDGQRHVLAPGSAVVVMSGERVRVAAEGDSEAAYYRFEYTPRNTVDRERGRSAGGSIVMDWDEIEMKETDKGGRRGYFDRPTSAFSRFEMHVTTLNGGLMSHPVHTHREEEFLLIMQGQVEEHIDGNQHPASEGDLIFLDAMAPHNITNTGDDAAVYFAFKWE